MANELPLNFELLDNDSSDGIIFLVHVGGMLVALFVLTWLFIRRVLKLSVVWDLTEQSYMSPVKPVEKFNCGQPFVQKDIMNTIIEQKKPDVFDKLILKDDHPKFTLSHPSSNGFPSDIEDSSHSLHVEESSEDLDNIFLEHSVSEELKSQLINWEELLQTDKVSFTMATKEELFKLASEKLKDCLMNLPQRPQQSLDDPDTGDSKNHESQTDDKDLHQQQSLDDTGDSKDHESQAHDNEASSDDEMSDLFSNTNSKLTLSVPFNSSLPDDLEGFDLDELSD